MKRSKHSLSHYRLTTLNQGLLYPVSCMEVLPGDTFRHQSTALVRVSPLVSPVMHPVHVRIHHWFVPNRIIWDDWEKFITGRDPDVFVPGIAWSANKPQFLELAQALGYGGEVDAHILKRLPFLAYNKIWNEFYRDQDLDAPAVDNSNQTGAGTSGTYFIRPISWEKDYFTTARPYPQQGEDTSVVSLDLSGQIPVKGVGVQSTNPPTETTGTLLDTTGSYPGSDITSSSDSGPRTVIETDGSGNPQVFASLDDIASGTVNMDINAWRAAMAMQKIREHRNRYGSRYRDYLSFLGVNSSDSRLDRPEYLGGGKQTISFSEVLSTADTGTANIGDFGGHGIAALRTRPYRRFFEEHGHVISLMSIRPKTVYQQTIPRMFTREFYDDFWQKEFEMLGDQEVLNKELDGTHASPDEVFGYVPRHQEYRHQQSFVTGEFRNILDYWHMARQLTNPALNSTFVNCDATDRIYASTSTDQIYAMIQHKVAARRLVSRRARNG